MSSLDLSMAEEADKISEDDARQNLAGELTDLMEALRSFRSFVAAATQTTIRIDSHESALCASKPYKNALDVVNRTDYWKNEVDGVRMLIVGIEWEGEPLTRFDLEVQIAIGHLIDLAHEDPVFITAAQIARELLGLTNPKATVPDSLLARIMASMKKLGSMEGALDYQGQMKTLHRSEKEVNRAKIGGKLLVYQTLTLSAGGRVVYGFRFSKQFMPMFYEHAKDTRQLVFAPRARLDTTRDNQANLHGMKTRRATVRFKLLQRYLYREIVRMVKTGTCSRGLTYAKIYENAGEPAPTEKIRRVMDEDVKYCLELWRRQGVIAGYTCKAPGRRTNKITVKPASTLTQGATNGRDTP